MQAVYIIALIGHEWTWIFKVDLHQQDFAFHGLIWCRYNSCPGTFLAISGGGGGGGGWTKNPGELKTHPSKFFSGKQKFIRNEMLAMGRHFFAKIKRPKTFFQTLFCDNGVLKILFQTFFKLYFSEYSLIFNTYLFQHYGPPSGEAGPPFLTFLWGVTSHNRPVVPCSCLTN